MTSLQFLFFDPAQFAFYSTTFCAKLAPNLPLPTLQYCLLETDDITPDAEKSIRFTMEDRYPPDADRYGHIDDMDLTLLWSTPYHVDPLGISTRRPSQWKLALQPEC